MYIIWGTNIVFFMWICPQWVFLILAKTIQIHVYSLAIHIKKLNCQHSGWFSNNIYMMNNICSLTLYYLLNNDIWLCLEYINNVSAQFFCYFLFYMKIYMINIIISGIEIFHYVYPIHFKWICTQWEYFIIDKNYRNVQLRSEKKICW